MRKACIVRLISHLWNPSTLKPRNEIILDSLNPVETLFTPREDRNSHDYSNPPCQAISAETNKNKTPWFIKFAFWHRENDESLSKLALAAYRMQSYL